MFPAFWSICVFDCRYCLVRKRNGWVGYRQKIAMYQKENTKIENQMDILVSQYMKFETDTYGELKNESSITLVSLYPDLKSDELVKKQIEVYESNNKEIREMKEKKIDLKVLKWWLYFGK